MVILFPRFRDTLLSMFAELSSRHIASVIDQLDSGSNRQLVDLKIPKFEIKTKTSLVNTLRDVMTRV